MSPSGRVTVDHHSYLWEERDALCTLFPRAEKVLVIGSENGETEFLLGVKVSFPGTDWELTYLGPVWASKAEANLFPRVIIGQYYLFPAFVMAKAGGIHGETIRSIVACLLSGRRLRRVNCDGLNPTKWPASRPNQQNKDQPLKTLPFGPVQ